MTSSYNNFPNEPHNAELISALIKFNLEKVIIPKTKTGQKGHLKFKYAPLDAIIATVKPLLAKHGLVVLQPIVVIDGTTYLKTILWHESGQHIDSLVPLPSSKSDDQEAGKTLKYKRRNAYECILGLCPEEDNSDVRGGGRGGGFSTYSFAPAPSPSPSPSPSPKTRLDLDSLKKDEHNNDNDLALKPLKTPRSPSRLFATAGKQFNKETVDKLKPLLQVRSWATASIPQYNLACELLTLAKLVGWDLMFERAQRSITYLNDHNKFDVSGFDYLTQKVKTIIQEEQKQDVGALALLTQSIKT